MKVESGIKSLVDILNEVNYVTTIMSCEGHFNEEKSTNPYVGFKVENGCEEKLENLIGIIIKNTYRDFYEATVEIYKRFYPVFPNSGVEITHLWRIDIIPFESQNYNPSEKRNITDKFIKRIENCVRAYLAK